MQASRRIPIHRIYNRAIADELISREVKLPFDLSHQWDVEWAGHPNWYFLISKYSIPLLSRSGRFPEVPPACFRRRISRWAWRRVLAGRGADLPSAGIASGAAYNELLLKPLFSLPGKALNSAPTRARLEAIPPERAKRLYPAAKDALRADHRNAFWTDSGRNPYPLYVARWR